VFLLVARFARPADGDDPFDSDTEQALAQMAGDPACRRLRWARATDRPEEFLLMAEFDSAADCRRIFSPIEARTILIPWFSRADQDAGTIAEVLASKDPDTGGALIHHVPTL
jgi:hypothetical protein